MLGQTPHRRIHHAEPFGLSGCLQTVRGHFDHVVLLNMRLVAAGPVATTFTPEQLQRTYGGRLTILDEAAQSVVLKGRGA